MIIRKIEAPSLAQKMSDLNHAAFGYKSMRGLSRYRVQQCMKDSRYEIYGAMDGTSLEGFTFVDNSPNHFITDPEEKCIEHFSVWPWSQGKGVGSMLLDHILNIVHAESSLHLTVDKSNKAVHLYKKFGFVEVEAPKLIRGNSYIAMRLAREKDAGLGGSTKESFEESLS